MLYRTKALQIALGELGTVESPAGSNSGARVREYQAATSLGGTNWPWCAAFVNWCFAKAGKPLTELDRSASVGKMLAAARQKGWVVERDPKPGDIVCYDWNELDGPRGSDWPDHVGIVHRITGPSTFNAIEGNTAVGNDSNGGKVMARRRTMRQAEAFIRVPGVAGPKYVFDVFAGGKRRLKGKTARYLFRRGKLLAELAARYGKTVIQKRRNR